MNFLKSFIASVAFVASVASVAFVASVASVAFVASVASVAFVASVTSASAQNTRKVESNDIGWYNTFVTANLNDRWGLHLEYQWRRVDWITNWQQSLLRTGINYKLHPKVTARIGYAWVETFPYGETPLNVFGKQYSEHRAFEMVMVSDTIDVVTLQHRFMLEQRWVGGYTSAELENEDKTTFTNRIRYMIRAQMPIITSDDGFSMYGSLTDEVFIAFGENVGENVFDQNRVIGVVGSPLSTSFRLEAGIIYQLVQLGREVDGRNVFQHNVGPIVNLFIVTNLQSL